MTIELTINEAGQIELPKAAQDLFGMKPGLRLRVEVTADRIVISKDDLPPVTSGHHINVLFSKPCRVIGRKVFDHLPFEDIEAFFPSAPPNDLLNMYRAYGRGTLCDTLFFSLGFNIILLESWKALDWDCEDREKEREVFEFISTDTRLGVGYGRSGRYYLLNHDEHTYSTDLKLEPILDQALCLRGFDGLTRFPFYVSATARRASYTVYVGDHFLEQSNKTEIAGLVIGLYFSYLGTHILLFDRGDRFAAEILTGKSESFQDGSMLRIFFDAESGGNPTQVFDILAKISEGEFRVIREEF